MKESFWPAVFTILIGSFMAVLDTSIVNVAIPKMMNVFGVAADQIEWVLTAYTLVMAAVIPLTGYLGKHYGFKKMYIVSFVLFTVGSLLCGLAWSNNTLIAARIIQALGGGLIQPIGQALLYQVVPREKLGPAMGVFAISVMVAPAIGPTLSGYIVQYLDWHLIFTINVPIGMIGILMAWTFLNETEIVKTKEKFDLPGFLYAATMLTTLLLGVTKGHEKGWTSFYIVSLFAASLICLLLLIYRELTFEHPLLDLRLFKIADFSNGMIIGSLIMIGMFGPVYLIPIYAESLLGYTAMNTGLLMFPQSVFSGIVSLIAGMFLMKRFGSKPLILLGLSATLINGIMLTDINMNTTDSTIRWLLSLRGLGLGLCMMPTMQMPLDPLDKSQTGNGSALLNISRQVALSIGVAILTSVFQTNGVKHAVQLANTVNASNPINSDYLLNQQNLYMAQGFSSNDAYGYAVNSMLGLVQKYATIQAVDDALWVAAIFVAMAIPLALLIRGGKAAKKSVEEPEAAHMAVEM
ncbi:DHA2 family efflux MFS transporter permease subunit [Fodinisporobacter ferrooxydans]|uniref:DHA2 family efflux MFS transporter permease subunit n=1 Tax=Fodinisporobacter ferrooxydans TaxID=2901836 RepID=A0ABY4CM29_9BACL|nr:DHA2 family efflux MFS transporter permease subunit [Alicyclobacillaceae bacterium MYW30-H2]